MPNPVGGLLEVYKDMVEVLLVLEILLTECFSQKILRLKNCSVVLLPAQKPAGSSSMILSAYGFNLFNKIFSMTKTCVARKCACTKCTL